MDAPADDNVPAHNVNPIVAFIIGLGIILLASILNAAGLNLTKLDHVRTSAVPKELRRRDWLRPLWLLGMVLYILSQLIGSTLALEYMRAEYVAPLGSSSLVFNFLFARFLVGTPVTGNDIWGTVVVILGVIGIVAFGSINSGLASETDVNHLTHLWRRGGWLGFFFAMSISLILVIIFTASLDAVLAARSEINAEPFAGMGARRSRSATKEKSVGFLGSIKEKWETIMIWVKEALDIWTAAKTDKQIAWTLGIGWACCGGGLAGGTLVFAKATVKLISGSLTHVNPGNQFGHVAPIFTFILLAVTAVAQIICLNRGLKVYDSTLVVPVFYGVYTATGFLNSLIFNDEVDAYKNWTLFLIFVSIVILICGVVLLTHKKPAPPSAPGDSATPLRERRNKHKISKGLSSNEQDEDEEALNPAEDEEQAATSRSQGAAWQVGDATDDEDDDAPGTGDQADPFADPSRGLFRSPGISAEEGRRLMNAEDEDAHHSSTQNNILRAASPVSAPMRRVASPKPRRSDSSDATLTRQGSEEDEFGEWKAAEETS